MTNQRWLTWLACLTVAGFVAKAGAASATEQRCSELGLGCLCSEPLDSGTVNGGQTWPRASCGDGGVCYADPDDSPDSTECPGEDRRGHALTWVSDMSSYAVPASSQPLPSGHSISWILRVDGGGIGHLTGPDILESKSVSVCLRSYQRWDPSSAIPDAGTATGNSQIKVSTIGGLTPNGQHNPFQMSVVANGSIGTRADSVWYNCPPDFAALGTMQECQNNFCRFEMCLDLPDSGLLTARFRKTVLAPSPQAGRVYEWAKPQCQNVRNEIDLRGGYNSILEFYIQNVPGPTVRYMSHGIMMKQRPADPNFWPGPAYEIEGGEPSPPPPSSPPPRPIIKE